MPPSATRIRLLLVAMVGALVLAACAGQSSPAKQVDPSDWPSVLAAAKGQTVHWYMYGGDDQLNAFVADEVAPRLEELEVELEQVRIADTADAVNKVLGEKRAGKESGGAVDAIWINGENFATGVQADLWRCGWASSLPNARYVDFAEPAVKRDFGVPVNGCESVWQQANSAIVYDSADLDAADVATIDALLAWAKEHPGRFTYPALPDFTGSMAVRSILYASIGGPAGLLGEFDPAAYEEAVDTFWKRLNAIEPSLWRSGETYPTSQDQVEKLYADGVLSVYFTYGPGAVAQKVKDGLYPPSTREAVPTSGNISNYSFIAIPDNAGHGAAALVLANVLQEPEVQLALYRAAGIFPGIDVSRTTPAMQKKFADVPTHPSVLSAEKLSQNAQPELGSAYITRLEEDWRAKVLQK